MHDLQVLGQAGSAPEFSLAAYRANIALWCAKSNCPTSIVQDEYYINQIHLLRPGTAIPSQHTVGRDLLRLHNKLAIGAKKHFKVSIM